MRRLTKILLVIYTVLTTYSIVSRFFGVAYLPFITPLITFLAFGFAVLHGWQRLGWRQMSLLLALTFGVSLLFESIGVATGMIYGDYHYTDKLGHKFLDLVPLLIPLAWFMMTYPAYIITIRLAPEIRNTWAWRLWVAAIGAVVMTAWDLAMDPTMVASGHWVWDEQGDYFGVPIQNYWVGC
jgi:putative membrane protein